MSVETLQHPDLSAARDLLAAGMDRGDVLTIFGRCEVDYEGRASSYLGPGDRLVVLKPDGTLLVHTDEQRTPVNWQPPGCDHEVLLDDDQFVVKSVRESPEELIEIRFLDVFQVSALSMVDEEELELAGSEADLRERIVEEPSLVEAGFEPIEVERPTDAGACDVFGEDADGQPVVLELKRRRVGPDAVGQLSRYVEALERELGEGVRGILVAPSVTERAEQLLAEKGLEHVAVTP